MLHALRIKIFAHLQRLGVDYYEHEMAGRIMTRMTTDIDALSQLLQNGLVNALVNLVTFIGVGVALVFIEPEARAHHRVDPAAAHRRDDLVPLGVDARVRASRAIGSPRSTPTCRRACPACASRRRSCAKTATRRCSPRSPPDYRDARVHAQRLVAIYFPFVDFLSDIATCVVLGAGSVLVAHGSLTVGELIAFLLYLNLFFAPIQQLSQVFDSYQQARVAIERITELLVDAHDRSAAGRADHARSPARRRRARRRALQVLDRDRRSAARRRPAHRARRDGRARGRDRRRARARS